MQLEMFATPFEQAQAEFERASAALKIAYAAVNETRELRDKLCPHTDIEEKRDYFPGSYYDTDYTDYWNQCKCCGAKSEVTRKHHGCYG